MFYRCQRFLGCENNQDHQRCQAGQNYQKVIVRRSTTWAHSADSATIQVWWEAPRIWAFAIYLYLDLMAQSRSITRVGNVFRQQDYPAVVQQMRNGYRHASVLSSFEGLSEDAGPPSSFQAPEAPDTETLTQYDPVTKAQGRRRQLPASRYALTPNDKNKVERAFADRRLLDTSSVLQDTTAVLSILISLQNHQTSHRENLCRDLSHYRASHRLTVPPSPLIS